MRQFTDSCINESRVIAIREKVQLKEDASVPAESAYVSVRMMDGAVFTEHVLHMRGSVQRPLSDTDLEAKFRENVSWGASHVEVDRLIDALWSCEQTDDVGQLMKLTAPDVSL
jgi:2-methylcitrate dehydratase PrpD